MSVLDMSGGCTVLVFVSAQIVAKFERLHMSVAVEKAYANVGAWFPNPHDGMRYKADLVLVYSETGSVELQLKPYTQEPPRPAFKEEPDVQTLANSKSIDQDFQELLEDYDRDKLPCSVEEDKNITLEPNGKVLGDLVYEVDVQRKAIIALGNNNACICWQENGTLAYFDYINGYPEIYHTCSHNNEDTEDYTSLARFIEVLRHFLGDSSDEGDRFLFTQPVWVVGKNDDTERESFNRLLADVTIDL